MSKKTDRICECGGAVRVTKSKGDKTKVGKNRKMRLPGVGREMQGDSFWYCLSCQNKSHEHPDDTPKWVIPTESDQEQGEEQPEIAP